MATFPDAPAHVDPAACRWALGRAAVQMVLVDPQVRCPNRLVRRTSTDRVDLGPTASGGWVDPDVDHLAAADRRARCRGAVRDFLPLASADGQGQLAVLPLGEHLKRQLDAPLMVADAHLDPFPVLAWGRDVEPGFPYPGVGSVEPSPLKEEPQVAQSEPRGESEWEREERSSQAHQARVW